MAIQVTSRTSSTLTGGSGIGGLGTLRRSWRVFSSSALTVAFGSPPSWALSSARISRIGRLIEPVDESVLSVSEDAAVSADQFAGTSHDGRNGRFICGRVGAVHPFNVHVRARGFPRQIELPTQILWRVGGRDIR